MGNTENRQEFILFKTHEYILVFNIDSLQWEVRCIECDFLRAYDILFENPNYITAYAYFSTAVIHASMYGGMGEILKGGAFGA